MPLYVAQHCDILLHKLPASAVSLLCCSNLAQGTFVDRSPLAGCIFWRCLALCCVWLESLVGSRSVAPVSFATEVATPFVGCEFASGSVAQQTQRGMDSARRMCLGLTQQGHTPLHRAAVRGHADVCAVLLDRGALLEARDDSVSLVSMHVKYSDPVFPRTSRCLLRHSCLSVPAFLCLFRLIRNWLLLLLVLDESADRWFSQHSAARTLHAQLVLVYPTGRDAATSSSR